MSARAEDASTATATTVQAKLPGDTALVSPIRPRGEIIFRTVTEPACDGGHSGGESPPARLAADRGSRHRVHGSAQPAGRLAGSVPSGGSPHVRRPGGFRWGG